MNKYSKIDSEIISSINNDPFWKMFDYLCVDDPEWRYNELVRVLREVALAGLCNKKIYLKNTKTQLDLRIIKR